MVHNRYLQRGGEDVSTEVETELLRSAGHEVVMYEDTNERIARIGATRTAIRTVWSQESYRLVDDVLRGGGFDVMHVQNFFPLISPSVYWASKRRGVPVVQALRNFRLLCPAATLYRSGRVCEECVGKPLAWPAALHGCYRGSRAGSAVVATMTAANRLLGTWTNQVDLFVTPSQFSRRKFAEAGWDAGRIVVKANSVHPDPEPGPGGGGFAVYVGRLAPEKGIRTLLRAWTHDAVDIPLKICGDGPLRAEVVRAAAANPRVEWAGRLGLEEVYETMGSAALVVVPSEWFEPFGRVVIEAYAKGVPVVASRIGALEELIADGETGLLVEPGNARDLAEKVAAVVARVATSKNMRHAARDAYLEGYTGAQNVELLVDVYRRAAELSRR